MAAYADDGAWLEAHAAQFAAIQLPRELWKEAARKVRAQIFDGGASLTYAVEADGGWSVVAARDLEGMDVWLVDHVWLETSKRPSSARGASSPRARSSASRTC